MQCRNCWEINPEEATFCGKCGTKLEKAPEVEQIPTPALEVPPPVPSPAPAKPEEVTTPRVSFWGSPGGIAVYFIVVAAIIGIIALVNRGLSQPQQPEATPSGPQVTVPPPANTVATGYQVGDIAPAFQLQDLEGKTITLSGLKGTPVVLNFWATWCGPCKYEMPFIQSVYNEQNGKGIIILTIDRGETASTVKAFLAGNKLTLPVLLDTYQTVSSKYGIVAVPTTFFIDGEGVIRGKRIGSFPSKSDLEREINLLLQRTTVTQTTTPSPVPTLTRIIDSTPPTVPTQLLPKEGAMLFQPFIPRPGVTQPPQAVAWLFDWSDSSDAESGIMRYHLMVSRPSGLVVVDVEPTISTFTYSPKAENDAANLTGWTWKVRALNGAGMWSDWSPARNFNVQPPLPAFNPDEQIDTAARERIFSELGIGRTPSPTATGWNDIEKNATIFSSTDVFAIYLKTNEAVKITCRFVGSSPIQQITPTRGPYAVEAGKPTVLPMQLNLPLGKYEHRVYANNILVAIFPFEIK